MKTHRDLADLCRKVARRADPRILALLRRDAWRQARFIHPKSYREKILRSMFFALTARINQMKRLNPEEYPKDIIESYDKFLEIVREYAEDPDYDSPLLLLYESLSAAYAIFLRDEPVHPPGTEFPGVGKVRRVDDRYYCPIKERREGQPGSFCTLCPAEQDPEVLP
ncbi:DUF2115 family protein [Methanopyrus sp.]